MLTFSATQRIYLAVEPVDMRKQFNGLWTLAAQKLHEDPFSGALFVFVNKGRDRVKILFWDGTGLCLFSKRIDQGGFTWPRLTEPDKTIALSPGQLAMLIEGIDWRAPERIWRPAKAG